ncbi:cadmium resistance transporter [Phormidium tenue]|uniref:Transporter n=1 Tax=Phormidium tenue NIES-30 TaxID=549789 RepID=A0A1U7IZK8_9CYAN|nr:cadmium resistance transporter [Phormidium tenue]MBD2234484.1 cadmium resistance transporter [Phormidium tenue FACHB-1052]OKH44424.1 transporter [Phormidium tenue NIES-30]
MDWIVPTVMLGLATATATTFDDNIYLTMFFSKTNRTFRPRHIVVGEFVGFTGLVGISLIGYFAGLMIPHIWVGLLGFLPIAIGVNALLSRQTIAEDETVAVSVANPTRSHYRQVCRQSLGHTLRDPQTYRVSAVTLANGGNNIAIYIPLFASSTLPRLSIILAVCYAAIGLWLALSYSLTRQPQAAFVMANYVRRAFPFVLIWLGASIVLENGSYQLLYALAPGL